MRPLALVVVRAAGYGRAALVVGSTAVVSGLLMVAVSIARFDGSDPRAWRGGHTFDPIVDPGTRPGAVVAVVLLVLPLLLLLDQAVRLGSTSRQRRYAALAVAGATRSDLRRWGALEVGLPGVAGALLGVPVWLALRELLGVRLATSDVGALVPTTTTPGFWAVLVAVLVAAYALLVGRRAGAHLSDALAGSRGVQRPPRPWAGLLLLAAGLVLAVGYVGLFDRSDMTSLLSGVAAVVCGVAGLAALAAWTAYRVAALLSRRARSGSSLLATGRLVADPRPAGRAASAVGAVALAGGVLGAFVRDVQRSVGAASGQDPYLTGAAVVAVCAVTAVLVIAASLAVHSAETLLSRRRELAALVATGVPPRVVSGAHRLECLIVTVPLTLAGALLGGLGFGLLAGLDALTVAYVLLATALTTGVVLLAVLVTTRLLRPWVLDALDADQLRTE